MLKRFFLLIPIVLLLVGVGCNNTNPQKQLATLQAQTTCIDAVNGKWQKEDSYSALRISSVTPHWNKKLGICLAEITTTWSNINESGINTTINHTFTDIYDLEGNSYAATDFYYPETAELKNKWLIKNESVTLDQWRKYAPSLMQD